jgi:hypothetical protein
VEVPLSKAGNTSSSSCERISRRIQTDLRSKCSNNIDPTRSGYRFGGPLIVVSTLCDSDEPLEILPSDFHGIRVVQIPLANLRSAYVRSWTAILRQLLHWPEPKVTEWISRWSKELSGASGPFYHRPPLHYIAPTIVKEKLGAQIIGGTLAAGDGVSL